MQFQECPDGLINIRIDGADDEGCGFEIYKVQGQWKLDVEDSDKTLFAAAELREIADKLDELNGKPIEPRESLRRTEERLTRLESLLARQVEVCELQFGRSLWPAVGMPAP